MIVPFSDNSDTFQICNAWLSDSISLIRALFFSFNLLLYVVVAFVLFCIVFLSDPDIFRR